MENLFNRILKSLPALYHASVVNLTLLNTNPYNCHSCESRNLVQKHWIPGQARNDKQSKGTSDSLY
jgi:hypothetical protein